MSSTRNKKLNYNKTVSYFQTANKFLIIGGLPGYLKWRESGYTRPIYKHIQNFLTVCCLIFIGMELGAFVTQKSLSAKQEADRLILSFSHPLLITYSFIIGYHKEQLKDVIFKLCIPLKNVYNDIDVERQMIKKTTVYVLAFLLNFSSALFSYGIDGLLQIIRSDGTFVTVVTAWPDVHDKRPLAYAGRVVGYIMWWICMSRVAASFSIIIITMGSLCYQYKNLQSYFYSLNDIFDMDEDLDEADYGNAEARYEEAFRVGIRLHADTLWCTRQCQAVCSIVYSAQIVLNVTVFALLMLQMMNSDRTLATALAIVLTTTSLLSSTGILMWNAGDVTVEAALVATAMYSSGWQHCRGARSRRVRRLVVIAMTQAQRHVVIRSFGTMEISYQAYVSIVKSSYSIFSLLYSR